MAVERGDSSSAVGATVDDSPSTFEQSTLKGTTTTGNARLIVRDATQIAVIDTYNYWISNTVEGVLDEIANLIGLDGNVQDQIDALDVRVTANESAISTAQTDILSNASAITALDVRVTQNETDISTNASDISDRAVISGTPSNNRIAVWVNGTEIEGDSGFLWDGVTQTIDSAPAFNTTRLRFNPSGGVAASVPYFFVKDLSATGWTMGFWDDGTTGNQGTMTMSFSWTSFKGTVTADNQPTGDAHLTRKDYVDTKAEDEAIAFAIALGG